MSKCSFGIEYINMFNGNEKYCIQIDKQENYFEKFQKKEEKPTLLKELIIFLIISVSIVFPFRLFVAEPYIVAGSSMSPTFETGHYLIVDKISYKFNTPERYDVIVMKYPKDTSKDFIKRIVGLPGEKVIINNGKVTIVNAENPNGFEVDEKYVVYSKNESMETTLDQNEYFVMGDNRSGSFDSRYWGPLPLEDIIGKPVLRLFPVKYIGVKPGSAKNIN